mmetsp:Transcript_2120/g.5679  ORF Transcript_2120/g.5679 Transcript_2120/m.5679 type:complete len:205 (-) Transcript_2120:306-920(-)
MSTGKQATYYAAWQPDHAINSQETLLLLSALLLFAMHFSLVRLSIVPPRKRMPTMPARKLPHALVNLTHVCNQILRQREPLRAFLALERPRRLVRMHRPHMPLHIIRPPKHLPADRARRLCARRRRGLRAFRGVRATGGRRGPARARGGSGSGLRFIGGGGKRRCGVGEDTGLQVSPPRRVASRCRRFDYRRRWASLGGWVSLG